MTDPPKPPSVRLSDARTPPNQGGVWFFGGSSEQPSPTTNATMKEKAEVLRNDQRVRAGSTYLSHTHDDEGGRFAKPQQVIGATGAPEYPRLPENSWTNDPVPPEAPLGRDVNQIEPQGEAFEIERALAGETAAASVDDPLRTGVGEAPSSVVASPAEVEPLAIQQPKRMRGE